MRPLRLLLALSLSWLCAGYSIQRVRSRSLRLKDANNVEQSGSKSSIKLPIVQLIDEKQEMLAEFVCGNDLSLALDKLRATLKTLSGFGPSDICETYVSNVYSDEQLTSLFIHGEKLLILKIYRDGCKKCTAMEPKWVELADEFKSPRFKWLQAEVQNIPEYTAALKLRLKGEVPPSADS